jgi:peptidoglycan/xylan/chitin deacetylase (PgdA/CDA1 family)
VSLTFDDGLASQRTAAALLEARGLAATFYVSSGLVGEPGRLTWDEVRSLAAAGHEIGGHTRTHVHLPDVADGVAEDEIRADRNELLARGLDPVTFAFPFGENDERSRAFAQAAGYRAARAVGGLLETIPPEDLYDLRAPHSARGRTNADDLAAFVRVAEHEGAWVIPIFHHVGDGGESEYTTRVAELERFLDWLLTRDVDVRRVCDVVD